jgi:hypothetical protein
MLFDYCHLLDQALADWFYSVCWASLRSAPTCLPHNVLTRIKAPSGHQTCLGPTLAMSYPIDGRGRHESPAVIRPERGRSRGRAAR